MAQLLAKTLLTSTISLLGVGLLQTTASAVSLNFSYTISSTGDVISGMFEGEIQDDQDTVFVTDVIMPQFNGLPVLDPSFLRGLSYGPAAVSFSGSFMDFLACSDDPCLEDSDGFAFGFPDSIGVLSGPSYGAFDQSDAIPFEPSGWSLSVKTPEPATALLSSLVLGFGVITLRRKRVA